MSDIIGLLVVHNTLSYKIKVPIPLAAQKFLQKLKINIKKKVQTIMWRNSQKQHCKMY